MAKSKNVKNTSVAETRRQLEKLDAERQRQIYKAALSKLIIGEKDKKTSRTYTKFSKEKYRQYIENPTNYEKELRNMSNFLYRVSMPYRRFINYLSDIPLFYWNLQPQIDFRSEPQTDKILKNYYTILTLLENMNMPHEFRKVLTCAIREGVFCGFKYEDKNSFFLHKLDPDYCRIVEIEAGCFNIAFDFSFFQKYPAYLEYVDPYFKTLYALYEKDTTGNRWQVLDSDKTIKCLSLMKSNTVSK